MKKIKYAITKYSHRTSEELWMQTIAEMQKEHLTLKSTMGGYRCATHDYSRPAQNLVKKRDLLIVLVLKLKYRDHKSDTSHKFKSSKLYKCKHG